MSNRALFVLEKFCWVGLLFCGGMLTWEYFYPPELAFPKVVDAEDNGDILLMTPL